MVGAFSAIYLIINGIYNRETYKAIVKKIIHLLRDGILTILLCAFTLLPSLGMFFNSSRTVNFSTKSIMTVFYSAQYYGVRYFLF